MPNANDYPEANSAPEEFLEMIYRIALAIALGIGAPAASVLADDWTPLFNGKDLTGWKAIDGPMSAWKVTDGMLVCNGGEGGWLSTTEEYADFEVRVEFRVPKGGNSGVFLRAPHQGNPAFAGMEIQVLDDADAQYANLQPYQYCGSLYSLAAAKPRVSKPAGEWQSMQIRCVGRQVEVTLNGTKVVSANLDDYQDKLKEHPGVARTKGFLGLQNHGSTLEYRKVEVRVVE